MNLQVPDDLRKRVKATAKRKGLTLNEFCLRVLDAAVEAEEKAPPGFLEALEKLLREPK